MFVKGAKRQDKVAIRLQNEYISRLVARIPGIIGNESCYTTTERKTMYIYIYKGPPPYNHEKGALYI